MAEQFAVKLRNICEGRILSFASQDWRHSDFLAIKPLYNLLEQEYR
jgi:hypothetical protein